MKSDQDFLDFILSHRTVLGLPAHAPERFSVTALDSITNRVRRVTMSFSGRRELSFVIKHVPAGGGLEKYPSVIFPESRLENEVIWIAEYGKAALNTKVRPPAFYLYDREQRVLILEDMGSFQSYGDFVSHSTRSQLEQTLRTLGDFLGQYHAKTAHGPRVDNPAAALNRAFVFTHPIKKHELIRSIWESQKHEAPSEHWQERIFLQEWFLANHAAKVLPVLEQLERGFNSSRYSALTHGDLNGATLLVLPNGGMAVLDAEFTDTGCLAVDVGSIAAHVWALRLAAGDAHTDLVHNLAVLWHAYWTGYLSLQEMRVASFEELIVLMLKHAGSELLTRVLGATYFPYPIPITFGQALIEDALCFLLESEQIVVHLLTQSLQT